jgi:choice-of-anchor C domain-containing protein
MRASCLLPLALVWFVLSPMRTTGDDLPEDARKRVKEFEAEEEAIRKKAEADIKTRRLKLIEDLQALQLAYTKEGKLDEAVAIRERIRQLKDLVARGNNLLVNGSFEEGADPPADKFVTLKKSSTTIKGWVVNQGTVDYIGTNHWQHADGKRSVDMCGVSRGGLSQTFKTTKGQQYRVTFSLAGDPYQDEQPFVKKLGVNAAGKNAEFEFDVTGRTFKNMGWVTKTWDFTATADETTLEFVSLSNSGCGPAVDNVSVHLLGDTPPRKD